MNSQELIGNCSKRFHELSEERESFEQELLDYLIFIEGQGVIMIKDKEKLADRINYFEQTCKSPRWKDFYLGWIEGRSDLVKNINQ